MFWATSTTLALLATSSPPSTSIRLRHPEPVSEVEWDSFGFGLNGVQTDSMWMDRVQLDDATDGSAAFSNSALHPLADLSLSPTAAVLNYGQVVFEGIKAFRRTDGSVALFRPDMNARRLQAGAQRFLMPHVPTETFLHAVDEVVRANARWIPPTGKGSLYVRPMLMGTGAGLSAKPSTEYTFCVWCSPVGHFFPKKTASSHPNSTSRLRTPIRLQAVQGFTRAAPGGSGDVKASGNYAPAFAVQKAVKERGFDEVLCLDALTHEAVDEAGGSNFFAVFPNRTVVTPSLEPGSILAGVTRASLIELARRECDYQVIEGRLTLADLKDATEAFCCGTAASVTPVGCVSVWDGQEEIDLNNLGLDQAGPLAERLFELLTAIQTGSDPALLEKYHDWIRMVDP